MELVFFFFFGKGGFWPGAATPRFRRLADRVLFKLGRTLPSGRRARSGKENIILRRPDSGLSDTQTYSKHRKARERPVRS